MNSEKPITFLNLKERNHGMWREFIQELRLTVQYSVEIEFAEAASKEQMKTLERDLGMVLPRNLEALLSESDGVSDQYGLGIIWTVKEISQYNYEMRTAPHYKEFYMSFTDLFFFADAGNGDRFAFPLINGKVKESAVFAWNHENDSRWEAAFSLKSYLERLLGGKIKL